MGCDIHMYIEQREQAGKPWRIYKAANFKYPYYTKGCYKYGMSRRQINPYIRRNYELFAILADVRNIDGAIDPMSKPKGAPGDISHGINGLLKEWDTDAHSVSHFTIQELLDYAKATEKNQFHIALLPIIKQMKRMFLSCYPAKDIRLVFWFDN